MLDSWAWIEYFKGSAAGARVRAYVEGGHEIIISTINIAEVGCFLLREERDFILTQFMEQTSTVVPLSADIAQKAATLKHEKKMGLADAIVLATAREWGVSVATGDPDFKGEKDVIYLGK